MDAPQAARPGSTSVAIAHAGEPLLRRRIVGDEQQFVRHLARASAHAIDDAPSPTRSRPFGRPPYRVACTAGENHTGAVRRTVRCEICGAPLTARPMSSMPAAPRDLDRDRRRHRRRRHRRHPRARRLVRPALPKCARSPAASGPPASAQSAAPRPSPCRPRCGGRCLRRESSSAFPVGERRGVDAAGVLVTLTTREQLLEQRAQSARVELGRRDACRRGTSADCPRNCVTDPHPDASMRRRSAASTAVPARRAPATQKPSSLVHGRIRRCRSAIRCTPRRTAIRPRARRAGPGCTSR